jgi:hypothetical protein
MSTSAASSYPVSSRITSASIESIPIRRQALTDVPSPRPELAIEVVVSVDRADDPLDLDRPDPDVGLALQAEALGNLVERNQAAFVGHGAHFRKCYAPNVTHRTIASGHGSRSCSSGAQG